MGEAPMIVPKPAASACVFRGEAVLLVQRGKAPYVGLWSLPGGSIEPGETALEAAAREVAEETGIVAALTGVTGVNDVILRDKAGALTMHYVILVFAGTGQGEPLAASDAMAAEFVALNEVAARGVGRRVHAIIEAAWMAHQACAS